MLYAFIDDTRYNLNGPTISFVKNSDVSHEAKRPFVQAGYVP
jgi:hypothetical protein